MEGLVAAQAPALPEGLICLDLVRMTRERYLAGAKGCGLIGYKRLLTDSYLARLPVLDDLDQHELYIYRANHGQFNTVWGRSDAGYPLGWFLNLKPLLNPEDQRVYSITLPDNTASTLHLPGESALVFSLAALDQDAPRLNEKDGKKDEKKKEDKPESKKERESPGFTVELGTAEGIIASRPLSDFGTILPPLKVRFTKLRLIDDLFYEKPSEAVFQTITIPLSAFARQRGFDAGRLKMVRLRFDCTTASVILLSKFGFE